jgi:E3 ubiquitin-protein ligase HECTD3
MQIYKHLKQETTQQLYNFRWSKDVDQWWECKFIGEGIIDQGGGFRDTLSDISEELCPNTNIINSNLNMINNTSSSLTNLNLINTVLPYFIRSPNQTQSYLTTYKDTFILSPSCYDYDKYIFIGKLMGACLKSNENLVLNLSPIIWKKLVDETIDWTLDYVTIDLNEVKLLDTLSKISRNDYELKYSKEKTWSCILSDGTCVELKENGLNEYVLYEDRLEYIEKVKEMRLNESNKQLEALKQGIESVVTKHVLTLLTWSELEFKVCGSPEITIDDLKMSS